MDRLPIWVAETKGTDGRVEACFDQAADVSLAHVDVGVLRENLNELCHTLTSVLSEVRGVGQFRLYEVKVQTVVNAKGQFHLVGTPAIGPHGAITLKFAE